MTPKKFSLIPGNISRFFILMVIVLLATMGVMIQSAVNAWLKEKSYQVVDVSHACTNALIPGAMPPGRSTTISPPPPPTPPAAVCRRRV
jgi:hypothetical protein